MAAKKTTAKKAEEIKKEEIIETSTGDVKTEDVSVEAPDVVEAPVVKTKKAETKKAETKKEKEGLTKIEPKCKVGSIVFVSKDADADLNGFKLFPQYKKYTYTVEAYDADTDVYTLRKLNLSLKLKGEFILAPNERAHDAVNRKQF